MTPFSRTFFNKELDEKLSIELADIKKEGKDVYVYV